MFKKGDLLCLQRRADFDAIVIVLKVNKLSTGKYYYLCMLPDNTIESVSMNSLSNL